MTSAIDTDVLQRLAQSGNPRDNFGWHKGDGYYVTACRLSNDDVPALVEISQKWYDLDWQPAELLPNVLDDDVAELLPVSAWRSIGELGAQEAIEPLIELLREAEEYDEWLSDELPHVFGQIGPAAVDSLCQLAYDTQALEFTRSAATRGLYEIAQRHSESRTAIVETLADCVAKADRQEVHLATNAMLALVDLKAVEAAEEIERAFSRNCIDVAYMGDWNKVRQELGVKGLGLPMPRRPYDSLEGIRNSVRQSGLGIGDEPFPEAPLNPTPILEVRDTVGRNDPCPCGSGKKYKKCCR